MAKNKRPNTRKMKGSGDVFFDDNFIAKTHDVLIKPGEANRAQRRKYLGEKKKKPKKLF